MKVNVFQRGGQALTGRQIVRQRPLNRIEIIGQLFACGLAFDSSAFGRELLLGSGNLRLHLHERVRVTVAGHRARGDRGLQLRAGLVIGIKIGIEVVTLELRFGVIVGRLRSGMTAIQGCGAHAQRGQFGFKFFNG